MALTLRTVCGLSTAEIANAFVVSEAAVVQRLTRARRKIATAGIPYRVPADDELGHTDESAWKNGKDPWALQNLLPLEDRETGEFIIFVSSSFGGKLAIEKLVNRYAREIGAGRDLGNPIIRLGTYDRPNKEYGPIPTPQFEIVGWENPEAPLPPIKDALGGEKIPF